MNSNNNNIVILIPYFGNWPEWIKLYFYSCEQNQFIDWYFFTDCEIPDKFYKNIYFFSTTFDRYCEDISNKLNINFKPKSPYKLCGLKPFYGYIHHEKISNYDFWGFGDVDIIWGDLNSYFQKELLSKYDIFSTHADRISGHLALIRNNSKYNKRCFRINNWKEKLESPEAIPLDEQEFSWELYPQSKIITKIYSKIIRRIFNWRDAWVIYFNIMPIINFIFNIKRKKLYFKEQHTTPILGNDGLSFDHDSHEWAYREGKIINLKNNKEYLYLHFMIFKKNTFRIDYYWKENFYNLPNNYDFSKGVRINTSGFFSEN